MSQATAHGATCFGYTWEGRTWSSSLEPGRGMPSNPHHNAADITQRDAVPLDAIREAQARAWQAGERVLVETLLEQHRAVAADTEAILDLIYHEVILREQAGEKPTPDEYQKRFPQLAEAIKDQFDVHEAVGSNSGATVLAHSS